MLTRPKLIDPFQIVRMAPKSVEGPGEFRPPPPVPFPHTMVPVMTTASPARRAAVGPLAGAHDSGALAVRPRPAARRRRRTSRSGPDGWSAGLAGRRRRSGSTRSRTPCSRAASGRGDAVAVLARTPARVGAARLGDRCRSAPSSSGSIRRTRRTECAYILGHSETVLAFAEDDGQREKLESVRGELPALRDVVPLRALAGARGGRPRPRERRIPDAVEEASSAIGEDDLGTLIYTSGTTGPPKGCMLTHRNLVTAALRVDARISKTAATSSCSSCRSRTASDGSCTRRLRTTARRSRSCAEATRVPRGAPDRAPHVLPAVPRVYEKIHSNVLGEIERAAARSARSAAGRSASAPRRAGAARRAARARRCSRLQERLADRLVFAKVRQRLGGRLRVGVSGAAPLGVDVLEFFHSLGHARDRGLRAHRDRRARRP